MKKILVIYATAGIGHKKASLAVKQAIDEIAPKDAEVTIIDSLDHTSPFFKWSYLESYLLMVGKLPVFWGLMYYFTDNRFVNMIVSKLRRLNNWIASGKFRMYLIDSKPDVIVSTHFFASEVISAMKKDGELNSRLITVVTDYRLHSWWVNSGTDVYIVGSVEAKKDLLRWGTDGSKVKVIGIPVEPAFTKPLDKEAIANRLGLKKGVPVILVLGGGFGVGPILEIVKTIEGIAAPMQILAICGHNESLVKQLEAMKPSMNKNFNI